MEKDIDGEWHYPECKSTHILRHERCQCDEETASGTIYQVHDEDGNANCWPIYHHNATKRIFECVRCDGQFNIGLRDTTEYTEERDAKRRCSNCNSRNLKVKDVRYGDRISIPHLKWYDD